MEIRENATYPYPIWGLPNDDFNGPEPDGTHKMNLDAGSNEFVLDYTVTVENEGINCTAVCPGWVDTQMLPKKNQGKDIKYPGMTPASKVVEVALKDCHKGRDVSVCSFYFRYMRFLSKVTPHSIAMKMWVKAIKQYI